MSTLLDYRRRTQIAGLAALAVIGVLLGAPVAHGAATSATLVATAGTLNLDGADDTVTITNDAGNLDHGQAGASFASSKDWDTAMPGEQPLAANGIATITVNGGDGADRITGPLGLLAPSPLGLPEVLKATLDGEGGDDLLTGSRAADDLRGGTGDDRLVGFVGNDDVDGGEGNDTLVWNNGDNDDAMDGDAGNDGVEVNGAPTLGDAFTIQPGLVAGRVRFDRTNLVPFTLDILAERLEVNGLGGDDTMTASGALSSLILLRLDGGTGTDTITGADGPDLLLGDERDDTLGGGAGDDRIVGDRGNDTLNGGSGNDTLVWNNGDNNDVMNGEDGRDVIEVNGSPTAGDALAVAPNGSRVKLDRTNLVPFGLDIGTSEAMALNGLGGDDAVSVGEVGPFGVAADGGSGNDSLNGGGGAETFLGGSGNDTINPGPGVDVASGDDGDDTIAVRDNVADFTRCGAGTDQVTADAVALDAVVEECETVDRPPVQTAETVDRPPPAVVVSARPVTISTSPVKINKRKGKVLLACPAASPIPCRGGLNLLAGAKAGRIPVVVVLARASFELQRGETKGVRIKVPKGAEDIANRNGRLSALAVATTTSTSGASASSTRRVTLDFGKPKKKRRRAT